MTPCAALPCTVTALLREVARLGAVMRREATCWIVADNLLTGPALGHRIVKQRWRRQGRLPGWRHSLSVRSRRPAGCHRGTSVGAINGAKLAEGEGDRDQGLRGLESLWNSLRDWRVNSPLMRRRSRRLRAIPARPPSAPRPRSGPRRQPSAGCRRRPSSERLRRWMVLDFGND